MTYLILFLILVIVLFLILVIVSVISIFHLVSQYDRWVEEQMENELRDRIKEKDPHEDGFI